MPFVALALIIAAALGGGASVAANSALPGDALWGFKVGVNENVQGALSLGDKAKADWDIAVIQARLDEASALAATGKLNADTQADIESNFNSHAEDVAAHVAKLQASGDYSAAADIAARFQGAVAAHASTLAEAQAGASVDTRATLSNVLSTVQATLNAASGLSADASAKAAAHADDKTQTSGSDSDGADTSSGVQVHTGTSVQGGTGGIKVDTETGSTIGI